jgi:endopolyphosphatase
MLPGTLLLAASAALTHAAAVQRSQTIDAPTRKLTGRFLHITDVHPDPLYKTHASTAGDDACHRGKGAAGYYGAETSGCDSPPSLVNATFAWLRQHVRDDVDFVVWTGDSARHDNDEKVPRTEKQVVEQNKLVVDGFFNAFGKPDDVDDDDPTNDFVVPIIPSLGNNDVLPHNIFRDGPNAWTRRYLSIWRHFIPEHQRHQFQHGGWFSVEVVPGKLAVFSLNTLYFFASNQAASGCVAKSDPGSEQFEWLRVQLNMLRRRGMKAILIGHVPPARVESKVSWAESCWQKYALWTREYRDVIVTGLYGHMNIDHFIVQDFGDIRKRVKKGYEYETGDDEPEQIGGEVSVASAQDYLASLREVFSKIPRVESSQEPAGKKKKLGKIGGLYGERYSLSMVSPSIVPNYFPTIRIYSYNISGMENIEVPASSRRPPFGEAAWDTVQTPLAEDLPEKLELRSLDPGSQRLDASAVKKKKHKFHLPTPPTKSAPPGPAYSPQPLTLVSYVQYFANLTYLNNDFVLDNGDELGGQGWKRGKHHGKPAPKPSKPREFAFEVEYDTAKDAAGYGLGDLTVRSWLDLAARIGDDGKDKKKKGSVWRTFVTRAFVGAMEEEDLEELVG